MHDNPKPPFQLVECQVHEMKGPGNDKQALWESCFDATQNNDVRGLRTARR